MCAPNVRAWRLVPAPRRVRHDAGSALRTNTRCPAMAQVSWLPRRRRLGRVRQTAAGRHTARDREGLPAASFSAREELEAGGGGGWLDRPQSALPWACRRATGPVRTGIGSEVGDRPPLRRIAPIVFSRPDRRGSGHDHMVSRRCRGYALVPRAPSSGRVRRTPLRFGGRIEPGPMGPLHSVLLLLHGSKPGAALQITAGFSY
jgi:hypothetical protein